MIEPMIRVCEEMNDELDHEPVLINEVIENLAIKANGIYIDATFGRGGHARLILEKLSPQGHLLAIDKDLAAIDAGKKAFAQDKRFVIEHGSFAQIDQIADKYAIAGKIDGILLDLGMSSPQIDDPSRGFSFLHDGPLDMRMDITSGLNATEWVNHAAESEIVEVIKNYGEERFARRIANAIVRHRSNTPITRTRQLASIISQAKPVWEKSIHPATRSFQAIRIFVNRELDDLTIALEKSVELLASGGRLCVISFHSLEDRIVKHFIRRQTKGIEIPREIPLRSDEFHPKMQAIGSKFKASEEEIKRNPRARSATLRVAERV